MKFINLLKKKSFLHRNSIFHLAAVRVVRFSVKYTHLTFLIQKNKMDKHFLQTDSNWNASTSTGSFLQLSNLANLEKFKKKSQASVLPLRLVVWKSAL